MSAVYTALLTEEGDDVTRQMSRAAQRKAENERPNRRSALEMLNRQRKLVLLGDPGSGKSAFVNFVALCHAGALLENDEVNLRLLTSPLPPDDDAQPDKEKQEPKPQPWDHGALLPVRILLRDWAASHLPPVGEKANASHLWNFLQAELQKAELGDFAEPLHKHLLEKGGLVLLDGLDEVSEADQRRLQTSKQSRILQPAFPIAACWSPAAPMPIRTQPGICRGLPPACSPPLAMARFANLLTVGMPTVPACCWKMAQPTRHGPMS